MKTLLICLSLTAVLCIPPSARIGLDPSDIDSATDFAKDTLINALKIAPLPEFHYDEHIALIGPLKMDYTNLKFTNIDKENLKVTFSVKENQTLFEITDLKMNLDFDYKVDSYFLEEEAKDTLQINKISLSGKIHIGSMQEGEKFIPFLEIQSAEIKSIESQMIDVEKISPFRKALNYLLSAVSKGVQSEFVKDLIKSSISQVNADLKKFFQSTTYNYKVNDNVSFNFALTEELKVSNDLVQASFVALFMHKGHPFIPKDIKVPQIKEIEEDYAALLSANVVNSALFAAAKEEALNVFIDSSMTQGILTTDSLESSAKGIVAKFGSGKKISIDFIVIGSPEASFDSDKITALFSTDLRFVVGNDKHDPEAFMLNTEITVELAVKKEDSKIFLEIETLSLGEFTLKRKDEDISEVNPKTIKGLLGFLTSTAKNLINDELKKYSVPVVDLDTFNVTVKDNLIKVGGKYNKKKLLMQALKFLSSSE